MNHTAINAKHQRALNSLYKADRKLCALINANEIKLEALEPGTDKYYNTSNRFEEREGELHWNLVERYVDEAELPKREIDAFTKSYVAFHGYTPYLV